MIFKRHNNISVIVKDNVLEYDSGWYKLEYGFYWKDKFVCLRKEFFHYLSVGKERNVFYARVL